MLELPPVCCLCAQGSVYLWPTEKALQMMPMWLETGSSTLDSFTCKF